MEKYLVEEHTDAEIFTSVCDTLDQANMEAAELWNKRLTRQERGDRSVRVVRVEDTADYYDADTLEDRDSFSWEFYNAADDAPYYFDSIRQAEVADLVDDFIRGSEEYEDLTLDGIPYCSAELEAWVQDAHDEKCDYSILVEGYRVRIEYDGTR